MSYLSPWPWISYFGKICPMIPWVLEGSITYTLITKTSPKTLWCGTWLTISIIIVVHCGRYWNRKKMCDTWFLGDWEQMYYHTLSSFLNWSAVCFYASKIQNINLGQATTHRLYQHMPPQAHKCVIIEVQLISNV